MPSLISGGRTMNIQLKIVELNEEDFWCRHSLLDSKQQEKPFRARKVKDCLKQPGNLSSQSTDSTVGLPVRMQGKLLTESEDMERVVLVKCYYSMPCKRQQLWPRPPALSSSYSSLEAEVGCWWKSNPTELLGGVLWLCNMCLFILSTYTVVPDLWRLLAPC